jgi:quercetin dioxygenase-like cupin family protein
MSGKLRGLRQIGVLLLVGGSAVALPAGVAHDGRNTGVTKAALVSVFFAEEGKPLATPVSSAANNPRR